MSMRWLASALAILVLLALAAGCTPDSPSDDEIRAQVESALASASDLPQGQIQVDVEGGVVTLTGTLACEECGGQGTPPGIGTVQQSLGAVVRAVPGVERVEFALQIEP